jgi:rhodanese-related sulfurtransferase
MSNIVSEKIQSGAIILDVRTPDEFRDGAYRGAVNIPLSDLVVRKGELKPDVPVVVYCASGARSARAARLLKEAGFREVINAGGLAQMPA